MAWFDALMSGGKMAPMAATTIHGVRVCDSPRATREMPESAHPSKTPCTRRLKPPQAPINRLPTRPPTAPAVWIAPKANESLSVLARIMGSRTILPREKKRLPRRKTNWSPMRLGRVRM